MSLLISKHIVEVLSHVEAVTDIVGNRIYPTVIPTENVPLPYIVHNLNGISTDGSKDGNVADYASVDIAVVGKDYAQTIELAHAVRYALADKRHAYPGRFEVSGCTFNGAAVEYNLDIECYAVKLSFLFETIDY